MSVPSTSSRETLSLSGKQNYFPREQTLSVYYLLFSSTAKLYHLKYFNFNIVVSNSKQDISHETQHVKVVDARNYESPEGLRPGEITLEFTKLMGQTPVGDKYVFDSPHSATLSCDMKAKRAKRQGRNRANRRLSVCLFFK